MNVLIMFHCDQHAGYAIDTLLPVFVEAAKHFAGDGSVHVSFRKISDKSENISRLTVIEHDPAERDNKRLRRLEEYIKKHEITVVFGMDQPVYQPCYKYLRRAGVQYIISYWGAPMSGESRGLKLWLKKIEMRFRRNGPNHYIFESEAMARTAISGRGLPWKRVTVVRLGVDTNKFSPAKSGYASYVYGIPEDRKIVYYSGHMEPRKGVAVLVNSAKYLYEEKKRRDFHFLILGNGHQEERDYIEILSGSGAIDHVTFGGYRTDVSNIVPSCYCGAIASTGWDSFTMSALEISSSGLPLVVSALGGLKEAVIDGETGFIFPPGDYIALSNYLVLLLNDEGLRNRLGRNGRRRVIESFSVEAQVTALKDVVNRVCIKEVPRIITAC